MVRLKNRKDTAALLQQAGGSSLLLHAPTADGITAPFLTRLIRNQVALLFGDQGIGALGNSLAVKYFSNATSLFIVRCSRTCVRQVWFALTLMTEVKVPRVGNDPSAIQVVTQKSALSHDDAISVVMQVLRVSGTIKKAEEEAIERSKAICGRVKGLGDALSSGISTLGFRGTKIEDVSTGTNEDYIFEDRDNDVHQELQIGEG